MTYSIALESFGKTYPEMEPLFREHYEEMRKRFRAQGINIGSYKLNLTRYYQAEQNGTLLHFVVRHHGKPIGYAKVFIIEDPYNGEPIAREDTIYIVRSYRNGIGRKLMKRVLEVLSQCGVKRFVVSDATDDRAPKLWTRMGFKDAGRVMAYTFEEA